MDGKCLPNVTRGRNVSFIVTDVKGDIKVALFVGRHHLPRDLDAGPGNDLSVFLTPHLPAEGRIRRSAGEKPEQTEKESAKNTRQQTRSRRQMPLQSQKCDVKRIISWEKCLPKHASSFCVNMLEN
jgi:hypothetical protein